MTRPASPTHRRIVFGAMGCAAVLVALGVAAWIGMRRLGFRTPPGERIFTPRTAAAALDSLARLDLSAPLAPGRGAAIDCADSGDARRVAPLAPGQRDVPVAFGDTFDSASLQYQFWEKLGAAVRLAGPAAHDTGVMPSGGTMLAAIRWRLDRDDPSGACIVLATLLERTRALQAGRELRALAAGAQLERDAMSMVARHPALGGSDTLRARAGNRVRSLDRLVPTWRSLQQLIDAAGTSPAAADRLAAWALDPSLALPVRDALVRAVGYGWVYDPQEGGVLVQASRRDAIARLARQLPEPLRATADSARSILAADLPARFRFAVAYRLRRDAPSW